MEFDFKMFSVHNNTHGLNFLHVAYRIVVFLDKMVCVNYPNDNSSKYRKRATDPENIVFSGFSLCAPSGAHKTRRHLESGCLLA